MSILASFGLLFCILSALLCPLEALHIGKSRTSYFQWNPGPVTIIRFKTTFYGPYNATNGSKSDAFLNAGSCKFSSSCAGPNRSFHLYDNIDVEYKKLYTGLEEKKWTFGELQNQLKDAGIGLEGCLKPDDVVFRVAQLNVLGRDKLLEQLRKNDPEYMRLFNETLSKIKGVYASMDEANAAKYIDDVVSKLKHLYNHNVQNTDPEYVLWAYAENEAAFLKAVSLPQTKPEHRGSKSVESYKQEADTLFNAYNKCLEHPTAKDVYMDSVINELDSLRIYRGDCKTDEQLINRLAYGRVFPTKEPQAKRPKSRKTPRGIPEMNIQLPMMLDPNSLFSSLFQDDAGWDGMDIGGGFNIFKDLASMFGMGNKQITFGHPNGEGESQDEFNDDVVGYNDELAQGEKDTGSSKRARQHIETDPQLLALEHKVKLLGNVTLDQMYSNAIQDHNLRQALKVASSQGYEAALEQFKDNKSALYILNKLNDQRVWPI